MRYRYITWMMIVSVVLLSSCAKQSGKSTGYQHMKSTKRVQTAYDCEKDYYLSEGKKKTKKPNCDSSSWTTTK